MEEQKIEAVESEESIVEQNDGDIIHMEDVTKVIEDNFPPAVIKDWFGHQLIVRTYITQTEMEQFVDNIVNASFDSDTGDYAPERRDFMYRYCEILFFTNVEMPTDVEQAYRIVYATDLNHIIEETARYWQRADIQKAIEDKIQYRLDKDLDHLEVEMNKLTDGIAKVRESFASIDKDDIQRLLSAIGNGVNLDEEKLVKAFIDAKVASDKNDDSEEAGES